MKVTKVLNFLAKVFIMSSLVSLFMQPPLLLKEGGQLLSKNAGGYDVYHGEAIDQEPAFQRSPGKIPWLACHS